MSKAPSPLLGFNNNIRHKGRVFHVQTEDSGVRHPHIITHLFMDGGRILKTIKTSYAEHLNAENMGELVRKMMKEQHKGMFIALRDGAFDELIIKHFGVLAPETSGEASSVGESKPAEPSVHKEDAPASVSSPVSRSASTLGAFQRTAVPPAPASVAAPVAAPAPAPVAAPALAPVPPPSASSQAMPAAQARPPSVATPRPPSVTPAPAVVTRPSVPPAAVQRPSAPPAAVQRPSAPPAQPRSSPPPRTPTPVPTTSSPPPPLMTGAGPFQPSLPPPPPNVLPTNRPEGKYNETPRPPAYSEIRQDAHSSSKMPAARPRTPSGRHAIARPSTNPNNNPGDGQSLFGDDLNEKSLDEVILSYLAEDLGASGTKK